MKCFLIIYEEISIKKNVKMNRFELRRRTVDSKERWGVYDTRHGTWSKLPHHKTYETRAEASLAIAKDNQLIED